MKNQIAEIYGLQDYGLTIKSFRNLGHRKVKIRCDIKEINWKSLFKYAPAKRKEQLLEWYGGHFQKLNDKWPVDNLKGSEGTSIPYHVTSVLLPQDVLKIRRFPEVARVWIKNINGLPKAKMKQESWYSIEAEFIAQIEGQTKGFQTHERTVIIVKENTEKRAKQKAMKEFRLKEAIYLNTDYKMVRWAFQRIIGISNLYVIRGCDLDGEEVFYEWKEKRIKPELEWHPMKTINHD
jgi:hypothetical protein